MSSARSYRPETVAATGTISPEVFFSASATASAMAFLSSVEKYELAFLIIIHPLP
jgi:hypothetical protein